MNIFLVVVGCFAFFVMLLPLLPERPCRVHRWKKVKEREKYHDPKDPKKFIYGPWKETNRDDWSQVMYGAGRCRACAVCGVVETVSEHPDKDYEIHRVYFKGEKISESEDLRDGK